MIGFGRGERKLRDTVQDITLLRRELVFKAIGIDGLLALVGWHGAKIANRGFHHLAPFRWHALDALKQLTCLIFLPGREVLPGFHPVENTILLLRGKAIKALQPIPQALLPLGRQIAELRIVFQRFLLLCGRNIAVASQPVASMTPLALAIPTLFLPLLALLAASLCPTNRGHRERQHYAGECGPPCIGFRSQHFPFPDTRQPANSALQNCCLCRFHPKIFVLCELIVSRFVFRTDYLLRIRSYVLLYL